MSIQYNEYLKEHISNVSKGFEWLNNNIPEIIKLNIYNVDYINQFKNHDLSKYYVEEYYAYDSYFYGGNRSYDCVNNFNLAWLGHIHKNPHHWQHWVLINDDEGTIALDMPYNYIIEMICDWWSFSWKSGNLYEIFDWYDTHKNAMIMSDKTKNTVESILNKIKERLDEMKGETK